MRYYFPESPNLRWFRQKGDCRKVTQAAAVDISKDAPLSKQEQQEAAAAQRRAAQAAAPRPGDGLLRFMGQVEAVHRWWNTPPAFMQAAEAKSVTSAGIKGSEKPIDKFDLQDVADTLDRLGFTLAATLLRKWFTNRAYRAQWKDALNGTVPDYPADMVDTITLKYSELVQHHYVKEAFDSITAPEFLRSKPMQDALLKVLRRIPQGVSGVIVSNQYGDDDMLALHRKYAFASVSVGRRFPGYYGDIRTEDIFRSQNTTDDVELALGEFRWFLALERVSIYPNRTTRLMQVKSVAVYAMASYGFETPEGSTAYKGHWNKKHVSLVTNGDWVEAPVYTGNDVYARNAVLWPITDPLFQQWREKHKKGGDMLLFTKPLHPWMQMLEFTVPLEPTPTGTLFWGGAGLDGPYIPLTLQALQSVGISNVYVGQTNTATAAIGWPGTFVDAFRAALPLRYEDKADWRLTTSMVDGKGQFNLIGYSYGSLLAAQTANCYANKGHTIDHLVLIGSPIDGDFLTKLRNHSNIAHVVVINLTAEGDDIYAGMPQATFANPLFIEKLASDMLSGQGEGHFYYGHAVPGLKTRLKELAKYIYSKGLR